MLSGGITERTVLGHHGGGLSPVFGVGGETVGGESIGDGMHGAAKGTLAFARFHPLGQHTSVFLADTFGHALGLDGSEELQGLHEKRHQQVVEVGDEIERRITIGSISGAISL